MNIYQDISIQQYNTFNINVLTKKFIITESKEDLNDFVNNIFPETPKPLLILGGGSNILFTENYPGTILKVSNKGIKTESETAEHIVISAQAGENWADFVDFCIKNNWSGLENLAGIPGNTGSSPVQNIGAYGVEMKDVFDSLEALEIQTGKTRLFNSAECKFSYRDSVFKNVLKGKYIITQVNFRLNKKFVINASYKALADELLKKNITNPTARDIADIIKNIRNSKLPDPAIIGNAGSFFKNPIVTTFDYYRIKNEFPDIIAFNQYNGSYKLAAGQLIELCGWKGARQGDAGVHNEQALVLVNYGKATGIEILNLANQIKNSIYEKFGIYIEPELNIL